MKWISGLLFVGLLPLSSWAQTAGTPSFSLHLEDGSLQQTCQAERRPSGGPDWNVTCGDQKFAVHLLVNKYPLGSHFLRYQILYWVLDYNDRPDPTLAGTHHGTNMTFTLPVDSPQQSVQLGQVVQTVWNLDVQVPL